MKRIIYIVLPALFLVLGAGKAVQNINNKQDTKVLKSLKTELEDSKKSAEEDPRTEEINYSNAKEIRLNNAVVLQGGENIPVETKTFKVKLPKNEYLSLYKPEGDKFTLTHEDDVTWQWKEISEKYFYKVSIKLDREQNCLFVTLYPIENGKTKPFVAKTAREQADRHVSYADFSIEKEEGDETIRFHGESIGMITYGFKRPILYIE